MSNTRSSNPGTLKINRDQFKNQISDNVPPTKKRKLSPSVSPTRNDTPAFPFTRTLSPPASPIQFNFSEGPFYTSGEVFRGVPAESSTASDYLNEVFEEAPSESTAVNELLLDDVFGDTTSESITASEPIAVNPPTTVNGPTYTPPQTQSLITEQEQAFATFVTDVHRQVVRDLKKSGEKSVPQQDKIEEMLKILCPYFEKAEELTADDLRELQKAVNRSEKLRRTLKAMRNMGIIHPINPLAKHFITSYRLELKGKNRLIQCGFKLFIPSSDISHSKAENIKSNTPAFQEWVNTQRVDSLTRLVGNAADKGKCEVLTDVNISNQITYRRPLTDFLDEIVSNAHEVSGRRNQQANNATYNFGLGKDKGVALLEKICLLFEKNPVIHRGDYDAIASLLGVQSTGDCLLRGLSKMRLISFFGLKATTTFTLTWDGEKKLIEYGFKPVQTQHSQFSKPTRIFFANATTTSTASPSPLVRNSVFSQDREVSQTLAIPQAKPQNST